MKILLFGASGMIGQRILAEAVRRGHDVTAVVRDATKITPGDKVEAITGDILDSKQVEMLAQGRDVVINATASPAVAAAESLRRGLAQRGDIRLIVVGGAGSLEVAPGLQLVDAPDFPADWKKPALEHRDALGVYRTFDIDWTYVSPAAFISPGERTGQYREGKDQLVTDENGESKISCEDFAVAILDEVGAPKHRRERFTVAA